MVDMASVKWFGHAILMALPREIGAMNYMYFLLIDGHHGYELPSSNTVCRIIGLPILGPKVFERGNHGTRQRSTFASLQVLLHLVQATCTQDNAIFFAQCRVMHQIPQRGSLQCNALALTNSFQRFVQFQG